jgi:beta-lactamase class A
VKAFALMMGLVISALPFASYAQRTESAMAIKASEIESRLGARVGLAVYDTGRGTSWLYHADQRFPLTSTFKAFACAALLHQVDNGEAALDHTVRVTQSDLVPYAPIMEKLVGQEVNLADICSAALRLSDNVAGNKVLDCIGGPEGLTGYLRSIGDTATRLDRREPELNKAAPGDPTDTTTPAAIAGSLRRLVLGDALSTSSRQQLTAVALPKSAGKVLVRALAAI